jgi:integrase
MLTDAKIERLKPRTKPAVYAVERGLRLLVYASGRKAWVFRYVLDGAERSLTIGRWPNMKIGRARAEARALWAQVRDGIDPAIERVQTQRAQAAAARITVNEFSARWMKEIVGKARQDEKPVKRILDREILPRLGRRSVCWVMAAEVQRLIYHKRDLGRPAAAKVLRDVLKRLFEYAKACGLITVNPVDATPQKFVAKLKSRTRTLSERELKIFFERLKRASLPLWASIALELLLLTMARKSELRLARWSHLDLDRGVWEIPPELSKTGKPHIVYLSLRAIELFRQLARMMPLHIGDWARAYVLPAQSSPTQPMNANALNKAMARVRWGMPHFTAHDLRRTGSTILAEQGYDDDWIEAALNHTKKGIRGVYNRAQYAEQRKKMLAEWADYLEGLKEG